MKEQKILIELREIYKTGNKENFKSMYYKNIFFISQQNRIKINKAIESMPMSINEIKNIIGGKIVE